MTTSAERFEVLNLIGFAVIVELAKRPNMMDLDVLDGFTSDARITVSHKRSFALAIPIRSAIVLVATSPSGAILAGIITRFALPSFPTWHGTEVACSSFRRLPFKDYAAGKANAFDAMVLWMLPPTRFGFFSFRRFTCFRAIEILLSANAIVRSIERVVTSGAGNQGHRMIIA